MRISSINVGRAESLDRGDRSVVTGINKLAVAGPVRVLESGVEGDTVCDLENHGGADQAVYAYATEHYAWWSQELGRELSFGSFGENLTICGFVDDLQAGDRLLVGDVILEATAPRIPCSTLAVRMGDAGFGLRFRRAERPGVYFRVLNAGEVSPGDPVTLVENPGESVSMLEIFRAWFQPRPAPAELERIVRAPVAERVREKFERLREVGGTAAGA
jgi:MOSC domain-containing protein YiiM